MTGAENKRRFFRLAFSHPLCADMKMIPLEDVDLDNRSTRVGIVNISGGGLKFVSPMKLPDDVQMLLEFKFVMLNKEVKLLGQIVRRMETERFEYSVNFTLDDNQLSSLIQLINTLSVKLRKQPRLSSCSFCTDDEMLQIFM